MSHQELKQEHKELEGNTEVKSKIRAAHARDDARRMIAAVPKADLVVMNPTHYAVALKYDDKTMAAPRVVAKGADLLALRIRDLRQGESGAGARGAGAGARALRPRRARPRDPGGAVRRRRAGARLRLPAARRARRQGADARGLPSLDVPVELDPRRHGRFVRHLTARSPPGPGPGTAGRFHSLGPNAASPSEGRHDAIDRCFGRRVGPTTCGSLVAPRDPSTQADASSPRATDARSVPSSRSSCNNQNLRDAKPSGRIVFEALSTDNCSRPSDIKSGSGIARHGLSTVPCRTSDTDVGRQAHERVRSDDARMARAERQGDPRA